MYSFTKNFFKYGILKHFIFLLPLFRGVCIVFSHSFLHVPFFIPIFVYSRLCPKPLVALYFRKKNWSENSVKPSQDLNLKYNSLKQFWNIKWRNQFCMRSIHILIFRLTGLVALCFIYLIESSENIKYLSLFILI